MCKSQIFAEIINLVAQEMEVPSEKILSDDKTMETVDARYLIVRLLLEEGLYPAQIASKIRKTNRYVNYIKTNMDARFQQGKMLRILFERIRKERGNN